MNNKFKERRVKKVDIPTSSGFYTGDKRSPRICDPEHDYSTPPELYETLVVMEPQPVWDESNKGKVHGRHSWNETIEKEIHWGKAPLKPGDVIPDGYTVLAVLGVERFITEDGMWRRMLSGEDDDGTVWHWKYLTTERFKSIVSIGH